MEKFRSVNFGRELSNPQFSGVNVGNLHDTTSVRLKSVTFIFQNGRSFKAIEEEVSSINQHEAELVKELYLYTLKNNPYEITASLGMETKPQKLARIFDSMPLDLDSFIMYVNGLQEFEPGSEDYEVELEYIIDKFELGTVSRLEYLVKLINEAKEEMFTMFKETYTGNKIGEGFDKLTVATKDVAAAQEKIASANMLKLEEDKNFGSANYSYCIARKEERDWYGNLWGTGRGAF